MKARFKFFLILIFFVGNVFSTPNESSILICKIKDQSILQIKEGISNKYEGIKEEAVTGESILIEFSYGLKRLSVISEDYSPLRIFSGGWLSSLRSDQFLSIKRSGSGYGVWAHQATIEFSGNKFNIQENLLNTHLVFERYYKNDWQMTFTDVNGGIIVVGNCMNQSGFQQILNFFDKHTEKK